jgi:hypothetical protein
MAKEMFIYHTEKTRKSSEIEEISSMFAKPTEKL